MENTVNERDEKKVNEKLKMGVPHKSTDKEQPINCGMNEVEVNDGDVAEKLQKCNEGEPKIIDHIRVKKYWEVRMVVPQTH